jgi:HlyD family secretion protein
MNTVLNLVKNKKVRNWGILVITVLVIGVLVWYFSSANASTATVNTEATVVSLSMAETIEASGSLAAQPFASLEWKTSGVVETVNVKSGDSVKAGDILLSLQASSTSSNIVSAQADLVQAQKDLEDLLKSDTDRAQLAIDLQDAQDAYEKAYNYRVELNGKVWIKKYHYKFSGGNQIVEVNWVRAYPDSHTVADADRDLALKKGELEDAQRAYERLEGGPNVQDVAAAQAKVDAAQATVNSLSIIAPFDGQVLSVEDHVGDTVSTGGLSVNLADLDHLYVETQVDESDIAKVKLGNQADVTLDALAGATLTGKVTAVNPVGEVVSGLVKYNVRVDLDKVKDDTFLPLGTTANVVIQTKAASATLGVPIAAIQNDSNGEYVWVVQSDGSAKRIDIVSGSIVGDLVAVTGDLKEGDRIQLVNGSSFEAPNPLSGGN